MHMNVIVMVYYYVHSTHAFSVNLSLRTLANNPWVCKALNAHERNKIIEFGYIHSTRLFSESFLLNDR